MIPFKTRIKSGVVQRLEVIESLSFQGQELTPGAATDEKAKISANDTTAGYLNGKLVAGSGIVLTENNNGGNETLTISANAVDLDVKVSVSANDTTAGYLNGKLVAGTGIVFTENNNGGDETLTLTIGNHDASLITTGTIGTARLGTGTANSSTYLAGDQTYKAAVTSVNGATGAVTVAATVHTHAASDITSGVLGTARLASTGTANSSTFLRGDQTWSAAPVTSVNTLTGAVTITAASIGAAASSHTHDASAIASGTIATARLGSGTASSSTFLRGDQTWASAGVTGFTSSTNSSFPNNFVNASRLLVDVATSSGDAVIQPKSLGAFQLALADGTATGGNKRGIAAIDLQIVRDAANNVAAGTYSIAIGTANRVDNTESRAFGNSNTIVAANATAIGQFNTVAAAGSYSHIFGNNNSLFSSNSVLIGSGHNISHNSVTAIGQSAFSESSHSLVLSTSAPFGSGNAQSEVYQLKAATTNATQTTLSTDGNALSSTNRLFIPNDTTCILVARIVARRTDVDNESLGYIMQGVVDNNSNFVDWVGGAPTSTMLIKDSAPWSVGMTIDNTNKAVNIFVTGEAGKSIRWMAHVELIKIRG
jgi:hypothetical protein